MMDTALSAFDEDDVKKQEVFLPKDEKERFAWVESAAEAGVNNARVWIAVKLKDSDDPDKMMNLMKALGTVMN